MQLLLHFKWNSSNIKLWPQTSNFGCLLLTIPRFTYSSGSLTEPFEGVTVKVLFFVGINFRGLVKNYKFVDS